MPLRLAVGLVAAVGLALVVLGVATIVQWHGRFSLGVGAMLGLYGLGVLGIAWLGRRHHPLAFGAMTAATVLHGLVVVSLARGGGAWWLWLLLVPLVATFACLMAPATRRVLGHYTLSED